MRKILLVSLLIFIVFGQKLGAQFMVSGNNFISSAKFVSPGKDSSSYVLGEFMTYEFEYDSTPNIVSYDLNIGDSLAWADSCGYAQFTNKIFVTRISKKGIVDWIRISATCDTLSAVQLIQMTTDEDDNLIILGAYNHGVELADSSLSSTAEWDMFLYKISPEGEVLWHRGGFASGATSAVIPDDIEVIAEEIYISGTYYGTSNFASKSFQSIEKQFFLLKTDKDGNDLEVSSALPVHPGSASSLNNIDFLSTNDIAGTLSLKDSLLIVNKRLGFPVDTIYTTGGFQTDVLYLIDSININDVISVIDSFYVSLPPPDREFFLVEEAAIIVWDNILDTIYRPNTSIPETKNHLGIFRGDSLALSFEIPELPIDFLVDRNDNDNMYGLYNYALDLLFKQDLIPAKTHPATVLVEYKFVGGIKWKVNGFSPSDTVLSTSFCVDPESNIFIGGSVGKSAGNHVLTFGSETLSPSYDEDCFVVKVTAGNVVWGQILGDSASDRLNDIYALDRFTIVGSGEYSKRIKYDKFDISTSGVRDLFVGSIQPYPEFDLNVISSRDEDKPLCEGDTILLVAGSAHDCNYQWMKDSASLGGETNDTLWVHESGMYFVQAISNVIQYDNLEAYRKTSKSFLFEFNTIPNSAISIEDSTSFCLGDNALLSIVLNSTDSCSWYELSSGFLTASKSLSVSQSGAYFTRIESEPGCVSLSDTILISTIDPPGDSLAIVGGNNLFCSGESLQLECFDPGINSYIWYKDGDSLTTESASSKYFDTEGAYSVKIINQNNCVSFSDTLTIVEIQPPVLESWFADELSGICEGEKAEIRLSNHSQTSYYWFYNNDSIKNYDSPLYFAEETGYYRASVVKEGVCFVASDTFFLDVHPIPTAVIKIDSDSIICDNESTRLFIESPDVLDYKWFKNGTEVVGITSSFNDISESGTYYSKFSNSFSCSDETRTVSILVKKSPTLSLAATGDKTGFCKNDSLRLNVENSSVCSYQWRLNGVILPEINNSYYGKLPGEYTVLLTDTVTQCTALTNAVQISEFALPDNTITYEEKLPLCERDTVLLSASSEANIYEWSFNGAIQVLENNQTIKASKNGTYRVKVQNENNCTALSSTLILSFLESQIPPIKQDVNYLSTLSYDHMQWYKDTAPINAATEQVFSVNESGFYHVEVTHANGCVAASDELQICVPFPEIEVDHNILTASEGDSYQWFFGSDTIFGANSAVYIAQLSGAYSVDITREDFCVSRSEEVEVCYPIPEIEIQVNNVLKASLGLSYQWYLNNEPISGAVARLFVVTVEGEYVVEVTDLDNCISFSDPVYMESSGINDHILESVEVYPNPFKEKINLSFPFDVDFTEYQLIVQNSLGVVLIKQSITTNPEEIQLASLQSGLYLLSIYNNTQRIHLKLIKK